MNSIKFQNNLSDWDAYLTYSMFKTAEGLKRGRQIFLYVQISFCTVAFIFYGYSRNLWIGIGWLVFLEAIFLIRSRLKPIHWLLQRDILRQLKNFASNDLESFSLQKTLDVSADTLIITKSDEVHTYGWSKIDGTPKTDSHIFIISNNRVIVIIPRRIFQTITAYEKFYALIQESRRGSV